MQTAAEMIALACSMAKCPGYTSQAGMFFNIVLNDLCMKRDLKLNCVTSTITIQGGTNGPFPLESDYLRTYDLFYLQNGLPYFLNPVSQRDYDSEFKSPSLSNYPYEYSTDLFPIANGLPANLYVYPQSNGQIDLTHRYMLRRPVVVSPVTSTNTVPWFPDQMYLVKATAAMLMDITDDERQGKFLADCEAILRPYLIMEDDQSGLVKSVGLDPRRFHNNRALRPTKLTD